MGIRRCSICAFGVIGKRVGLCPFEYGSRGILELEANKRLPGPGVPRQGIVLTGAQ